MDAYLPQKWTTENLVVTNSTVGEVDDLYEAFCSNTNLAEVDETFKWIEKSELLNLIECSVKGQCRGDQFQMQTIRSIADNKIVGYFHFILNKPLDKDIYISILVIDSKFQNRKIGKELIGNFLKLDSEFEKIALRVYLKNLRALNFWINRGFMQIRRLDLENPANASIILCRDLRQ